MQMSYHSRNGKVKHPGEGGYHLSILRRSLLSSMGVRSSPLESLVVIRSVCVTEPSISIIFILFMILDRKDIRKVNKKKGFIFNGLVFALKTCVNVWVPMGDILLFLGVALNDRHTGPWRGP